MNNSEKSSSIHVWKCINFEAFLFGQTDKICFVYLIIISVTQVIKIFIKLKKKMSLINL